MSDVTLDDLSVAAERIGYMKAFLDIINELDRIDCRNGCKAVALLGIEKGISRDPRKPQ